MVQVQEGEHENQRVTTKWSCGSFLFISMFYAYILYSRNYNKYYIGHTDNIKNRLWAHNNSVRTTYTSKYRPWELAACFEAGRDRGFAMEIERKIKNLKSKEMCRRIIEGHLPEFLAQLVRVPNEIRD